MSSLQRGFTTSGWQEGRDPSLAFDTSSHLAAYPDVDAADINPLIHFLRMSEGRSPFGDATWADIICRRARRGGGTRPTDSAGK